MSPARRQRLVGGLVVWSLLALAVWRLLVTPAVEILDLRAETAALAERLPSLRMRIEEGRRVVAAAEAFASRTESVVGPLGDRSAVEAAVRATIEAAGGELQSLRWSDAAGRPVLALDVRLAGTGLEDLLARLEFGRPPMQVIDVTAQRLTDGGTGADLLEVRISAALPALGGGPR